MWKKKNYQRNNNNNNWNDYDDHKNNNYQNQPIQFQKQSQILAQDQKQIVIETQLTLDQIDACFNALNAFYKIYNTTNNKKEIINYNALLATQLSIFGSMCNEQSGKGNKRSLDLCSMKLKKYCNKLDNKKQKILQPFIDYIYAAVKNKKVPIIPSIELNDNDNNNNNKNKWNEKTANNFMSNYLGSGHVVDDKIKKYKKNYKEMNNEYNKEWNKNGKNGIYMGKASIPNAKSLYKYSGNNIKFANIKQDMMSVSQMNKMNKNIFGDDDDDDDEDNDYNMNNNE